MIVKERETMFRLDGVTLRQLKFIVKSYLKKT